MEQLKDFYKVSLRTAYTVSMTPFTYKYSINMIVAGFLGNKDYQTSINHYQVLQSVHTADAWEMELENNINNISKKHAKKASS
jgi:hypothetical protein